MKHFPPHSSSSSSSFSFSSSSFSFDTTTMCTSKKATAGCLTGILRRILCSRGLPTHPSDQIKDSSPLLKTPHHQDHNFKPPHNNNTLPGSLTPTSTNATSVSAPCIVARLMGLDSMVELPNESTTSPSLSRSRSMNSVQCFGECDRLQGIHRRVKSTLSFRETPGFTFLENDDNFFVLSFDKDRNFESKLGSTRSKPKENSKREKVSSDNIAKNDGKLREVTNSIPQSSFIFSPEKKYLESEAQVFDDVVSDRKLDRRKRRMMRRKKKKKPICNCTTEKTEKECSNSEETSPVSVLEFDRPQVHGIDLCSPVMGMCSPRRKLSTELGNGQHFLLRFDANLVIEQKNDEHKSEGRRRRKEKQRQRYIDIWEEACKKAGDEVIGSNQVWKNGDGESIGEDLESEIFQYLVNELVDQLLVGR